MAESAVRPSALPSKEVPAYTPAPHTGSAKLLLTRHGSAGESRTWTAASHEAYLFAWDDQYLMSVVSGRGASTARPSSIGGMVAA